MRRLHVRAERAGSDHAGRIDRDGQHACTHALGRTEHDAVDDSRGSPVPHRGAAGA